MSKHNFLDSFDMVYIINLESRVDRKKEMEAQLLKVGLSLTHNKITLFKAVKPTDAGEFPNIGAKGCFLSHLEVLKDCQLRQFKRILIFEDDLNFVKKFNQKFTSVIAKLDNEKWDIFYGDYRIENFEKIYSSCLKLIDPDASIGTTNFIGFNGVVVEELIKYFEAMSSRLNGDALGGPMHVDGAYSWFRKDNRNFSTKVATPTLGYQRSSNSDIAKPSFTKTIPFIRTLRVVLNKIRWQ